MTGDITRYQQHEVYPLQELCTVSDTEGVPHYCVVQAAQHSTPQARKYAVQSGLSSREEQALSFPLILFHYASQPDISALSHRPLTQPCRNHDFTHRLGALQSCWPVCWPVTWPMWPCHASPGQCGPPGPHPHSPQSRPSRCSLCAAPLGEPRAPSR